MYTLSLLWKVEPKGGIDKVFYRSSLFLQLKNIKKHEKLRKCKKSFHKSNLPEEMQWTETKRINKRWIQHPE